MPAPVAEPPLTAYSTVTVRLDEAESVIPMATVVFDSAPAELSRSKVTDGALSLSWMV